MLFRTHRFADKVGVNMDLGIGGAAVNGDRCTWCRFWVSYWPGWVDLLDPQIQLRKNNHEIRHRKEETATFLGSVLE